MAERALKSVPPAREDAPESRRGVSGCAGRSPARRASLRAGRRRESVGAGPAVAIGRAGCLFALLPLALIAGGYWYVTGGQVMSTDDAYVEAEKVGISTDVSGIVKEVDVIDNQHVAAGPGSLPPRSAAIPDRARQRQGQSGADGAVDRRDEAGLQAHAERRCRRAGAGRARSDELRPQCHAAAQRHHLPGHFRSGALHARKRQEQA